jgi:hypothetical protein
MINFPGNKSGVLMSNSGNFVQPTLNMDLDGTLIDTPTNRLAAVTKRGLPQRTGVLDFVNGAHDGGLGRGRIMTARPLHLPNWLSREQATYETYEQYFQPYFEGYDVCGFPLIASENRKAERILGQANQENNFQTSFVDDRAKIVRALLETVLASAQANRVVYPIIQRTMVLGVAPSPNQSNVLEEISHQVYRMGRRLTKKDDSLVISVSGLELFVRPISDYTAQSGRDFAEFAIHTGRDKI